MLLDFLCFHLLPLKLSRLSLSLRNDDPKHKIYHANKKNNRGGQFRRTGVTGGNIVVGVVLGVLSGKYIFEEPIQRYWAEKHAADAAAAAAASISSSPNNSDASEGR